MSNVGTGTKSTRHQWEAIKFTLSHANGTFLLYLMANRYCGWVYIGIDENGDTYHTIITWKAKVPVKNY
jgi:hypothetical protein